MRGYKPEIHHRRSLRLLGYDYSLSGVYFITLCTHDKQCLFGKIIDGEMILNKYGEIVCGEWIKTTIIRPNILLDEFILMPNHIHGIIVITDVPRKGNVGAYSDTPQNPISPRTTDASAVSSMRAYINTPLHQNGDIYAADVFPYPSIGSYDNETRQDIPKGVLCSPSKTVGAIIRGFKSVSTKRINQLRGLCVKSVWQRNYYEHIILNERELNHIRQYIIDNPKNWEHDENYFIS